MKTLALSPLAKLHRHADTAGAFASGLCVIHCILTPFVISLSPSLLPWLPGDARFHRTLAVLIVLIGITSFVPGYRVHRRRVLLVPIAVGVALVLSVAWQGEQLQGATELTLSITGSLLLIAAHLANRSFCRSCLHCKTAATCQSTQP